MIERRQKEKLPLINLVDIQYALEKHLYEERKREMVVRDNFRREVIHNITYKEDVLIDRALFNSPNTIVVENGVLSLNFSPLEGNKELLTTSFEPHSPEVLSLNLLPIHYNPDAKCPQWIKFLERITGVNKKARRDLQKLFGYCLLKYDKYKKAFIILGERDTGKSVIQFVLDHMVGLENVCHITLHDLCDGNQFVTAGLIDKMVNTCGDLDKKAIENTGRFKMLVGIDPISIEQKGKERVNLTVKPKLVFVGKLYSRQFR